MKIDRTILYALIFIAFVGAVLAVVWLLRPSAAAVQGTGTSSGFFSTLFPYGKSTPAPGVPAQEEPRAVGAVPDLRKVSDEPVAGGAYVRGIGGLEYIRYVERNTGHIYETPITQSTALRLTNDTVPAVHDAVWLTGSTTLM